MNLEAIATYATALGSANSVFRSLLGPSLIKHASIQVTVSCAERWVAVHHVAAQVAVFAITVVFANHAEVLGAMALVKVIQKRITRTIHQQTTDH